MDRSSPREATQTLPELAALLRHGSGRLHLAGICGVGMAGLGVLLKGHGFDVDGCDIADGAMASWLSGRGIAVLKGHDTAHLKPPPAALIRTAAVPPDSPEVSAALAQGIPVFRRGEVLAALVSGARSVAVGGTHGKTTTSAFTACLLRALGMHPSWCVGGDVRALGGVAGIGSETGPLVVEADESDGTLALYRPHISVVTNIEFDHMEHFGSPEALEACFHALVRQTAGRVLYCGDDPRASAVAGSAPQAVSYGFGESCRIRAIGVALRADGSEFELAWPDGGRQRVCLRVPGRHNILNAVAAIAAAVQCGCERAAACEAAEALSLPGRRFDTVAAADGVRVISDYAHHPTEIAALVATARGLGRGRMPAVFQPHRFTRTRALGADFPPAFEGVDELVLLPVYGASEPPLEGGTTGDLYARFLERGMATPVRLAASRHEVWPYFRTQLCPGDVLLVVGAGDVETVAHDAARDLAQGTRPAARDAAGLQARLADSTVTAGEPLAPRTGLGVGGAADLWVALESEADLCATTAWCREHGVPFHLLGGGFNVLVSDLGVRGVVARPAGEAFRRIEPRAGLVVAGGGTPLARLLAWAETGGWAGFEFLEGIPGTVGGAVRMNAGAWGHEIKECLAWIRCLKKDGSIAIVPVDELGLEYRHCAELKESILLEAAFTLRPGDPGEIHGLRSATAERRAWMSGLRSAGSVFKNPPGDYAGRLLEQAGLKGAQVGGARVSEYRANFVYTSKGATASDVLALIQRMRAAVVSRYGIELELEVQWMA